MMYMSPKGPKRPHKGQSLAEGCWFFSWYPFKLKKLDGDTLCDFYAYASCFDKR